MVEIKYREGGCPQLFLTSKGFITVCVITAAADLL